MTITESNSSFLPKYLSFLLAILLLISDDDHCGRLVLVTGVDDYTRADFPAGFVFGAGTSAYQVEGAAFEDGRTASIFDTLAHDGYVRGENTRKMFNLWWIQAWRPSNSPSLDGTGPINPKGLQFYNNFINELIRNGIEPHAMLCHSDLPQILEDKYGGRVSQESVKDFTAYANVCFREFGDRVSHWTTFNEPNVFVPGGYDAGITQPVRCSPPFGKNNCSTGNSTFEPYIAAHNILLAHASAARLYQNNYKATQHGFIGINLLAFWVTPYINSTEDAVAVQRALDFYISWFVNPLVLGDNPEITKKTAGIKIPKFTEEESLQVKGSCDFLGLNHYYTCQFIRMKLAIQIRSILILWVCKPFLSIIKMSTGTHLIYIHENGLSMTRNGELNDTPRVEYLDGFMGSMLDAIRNG